MVEFGLESEEEELKMITSIKSLDDFLGEGYSIFFDHSYEMAANVSQCLWQERVNKIEDEFREKCDEYLRDGKHGPAFVAPVMTKFEVAKYNKNVDKCVAV